LAHLQFFEKPGCLTNQRQRALLTALGHSLAVRDLLSEPWTPARLRPFFGERPVAHWFNAAAPRVKSGQVVPDVLGEAAALALMVVDPLLIRRPLLETPWGLCAGFEPGPVLDALGVRLAPGEDLAGCSRPGPAPVCPEPAELK
jgi:nitrogenase-associated protein